MPARRNRLVLTPFELDKYGVDLNRLVVSMARSRKILQRYREERREAVRQSVGAHYSDDGTRRPVPVDLIGLYESIIGASLISSNPRFSLSTFQSDMKPAVSALQEWGNRQVKHVRLASSLKRIVGDALYVIGIGKVALASPTDSATLAWGVTAGEPLVSPIDLDDWVYDTQAHRFEEVSYVGHRFRCPIDAIKDSKHYDRKVSKELVPSLESRYNLEGDERISQIGKGLWWHQDDFEDMIDLWEVYLPRHRIVVTLANDLLTGPAMVQSEGNSEPLRVQRWIGPDTGPYHFLGFRTVGGNAMPKGPILSLIDMHLTANALFRKLTQQAERQKTQVWYDKNDSDADRIMRSNDGDLIPVMRPEAVKETRMGGPDRENHLFFQAVQQLFSWAAGNLDSLGGLSPQASTLGQDKLLAENSSRVVSAMQQHTANYVEEIGRALLWYWWHDPYKVMHSPYSPGGGSTSVDRFLHPANDNLKAMGQLTRHGRFEDLDLQVDPYSLIHQTPQQRLQVLDQTMTQVIIPMMPILAQQGIQIDMNKYLKIKAALQNMPELQEVVTIGQAQPPEAPSQEQPGMPAQTERKYVRENRSTRTSQGTTQNLMTALAGVHPGGNAGKMPGGSNTAVI